MTFEPESAAIVQLAWERILGFPDGALGSGLSSQGAPRLLRAADDGFMNNRGTGIQRLTRAAEPASSATFVRLFGRSALVAPQWFLDRAGDVADDELARHTTMLALSADHGGHGLGSADLFFADDLAALDGLEVTVSLGAWESQQLRGACPPDDVNESGLAEASDVFTILAGEAPLAGSGYQEWQGLLAHLGVLVPPGMRRQGLGSTAAGVAAHEALAAGLIPQWRASTGNQASQQLARKLGFELAGSQTTVLLAR